MRAQRETYQQNNLKLLFSLILILSLSIIGVGQTLESNETSVVIVPNHAMKQVVQRVLVWHFKPRNNPKVIYLAEQGLQKTWLPSIKNIEFQLLSTEEIEQRKLGVYFFTEPELTGNKYQIGFGFGDPNCNNSGEIWYFRISKERVRLLIDTGNFLSSCSSDA